MDGTILISDRPLCVPQRNQTSVGRRPKLRQVLFYLEGIMCIFICWINVLFHSRFDAEDEGRLYFFSKSPDVVRKIGNTILITLKDYHDEHPRRLFKNNTLSDIKVHSKLCAKVGSFR